VGYEKGGLLTEMIRKEPFSVLLLDEVEKAHPDIFNSLLQVMDYATLTDNAGEKADFKNVIIIMTSNAGAAELAKKNIGFSDANLIGDNKTPKAVDKIFTPEFRNRLDSIITFNNLNIDIVKDIVKKMLVDFEVQLKQKDVRINVKDDVYAWLAKKGYSKVYGAREIGRLIQDKVKSLFIDEVLFGRLKDGGKANISIKKDEIAVSFKKGKKGI